jgi:hypothetical protein
MKRAIVIGLLMLVSCSSGDEGFSDQARTDFMAGCTESAPEELCTCVFDELESRMSEESFVSLVEQGELQSDPRFMAVIGECTNT